MITTWYYRLGDTEIGPISSGGLRQKVFGGTILPNTLVRKSTDENWIEAKNVLGLFERNHDSELSVPGGSAPPAPNDSGPAIPQHAVAFDPYHTWLGIPPEEQPPNHYHLLGIRPFENNPDVIENAADRQMAHLRNRQIGKHSELSQQLLNDVATAKICLLTPARKTAYDRQLRRELNVATANLIESLWIAISRHGSVIGTIAAVGIVLVATMVMIVAFRSGPHDGPRPSERTIALRPARPASQRPPTPDRPLPPTPDREHPLTTEAVEPGKEPALPAAREARAAKPATGEPDRKAFPPRPSADQAPAEERGETRPDTGKPAEGEPGHHGSSTGEPSAGEPSSHKPSADEPSRGDPPTQKQPGDDPKHPQQSADLAVDRPTETRRLDAMREIFERQLALHGQCQEKEDASKKLQKERNELEGERVNLVGQRGVVQARMQAIVQALQVAGANPWANPQVAQCRGMINNFNLSIGNRSRGIAKLDSDMQHLEADTLRLVGESNRFWPRWFLLCDPFGKWGPAVHRRGLSQFDEWIAQERGMPLPFLARGLAHLHVAEYQEALADFHHVAKLAREAPLMTAIRGYALGKQGQSDKAKDLFGDAIDLIRQSKRTKGLSREELAELDKMLELIFLFRGHSSLEQGDYRGAISHFGQAVRLAKDSPEAHEALARIYATSGPSIRNGTLAVEHAKQAVEQATQVPQRAQAPKRPEVVHWQYFDTLAAAYAENGEFESAVKWANKAEELAPGEQQPAVHRRLELYQNQQRYRW